MKRLLSLKITIPLLCFMLALPSLLCAADKNRGLSQGQVLYVPAYSNIYIGSIERPFQLTVILSLRNIDPKYRITLKSVKYFETKGKFIKSFVQEPVVLEPLETIRYIIPEKDTTGGSGANFIVEWQSDNPINPPIVESVMIGSRSQQGISFTSRGVELVQHD